MKSLIPPKLNGMFIDSPLFPLRPLNLTTSEKQITDCLSLETKVCDV